MLIKSKQITAKIAGNGNIIVINSCKSYNKTDVVMKNCCCKNPFK